MRLPRHVEGALLASLLPCVGLVLLSACGGARSLREYPDWFVELPDGPYAVGYSSRQEYESSEILEGAAIAAKALAVEQSVTVDGGSGAFEGPYGTVIAGSDLRESGFESRVDAYDDPERVLASARLDDIAAVLLSKHKVPEERKQDYPQKWRRFAKKPPDWVRHPPDDPNYVYAVGASGKNEYEVTSWKLADRHACFRLALNQIAHVKGIYREGGVSLVEVDNVQVRGVRIMKRWRDRRDGSCYVLARAKKP